MVIVTLLLLCMVLLLLNVIGPEPAQATRAERPAGSRREN
jgi:hypothetical protein